MKTNRDVYMKDIQSTLNSNNDLCDTLLKPLMRQEFGRNRCNKIGCSKCLTLFRYWLELEVK